ncbi:bifunctional folylpolyglutamate synthase/dihydrofolate synthase [Vallitalea okinawensis]|uniref:bifunctional folylpolyglutamate synthase/dihydrofolate synthase n=1 Tax=Vallitalea okinawensis TaxID=2078660 RepID=UPI000CFDC601|nr:folylpolyglutamate synthase/dihydrofolate synthase family protein [Vallitalea okinawensis]
MNYQELIDYLNHIPRFTEVKEDLSLMENLMKRLGNPQDQLRCIHVAGTNGKGSVCAMTTSILLEEGYTVGTFTSPHLIHFNERMKICNEAITDEEFSRIGTKVKEAIEEMIEAGLQHPTFFEVITACAFYYFALKKVDYAVIEVGLGGRLDATNIIKEPIVTVITPISLDHTSILGDNLEDITGEKAGIIKKNCPVVLFSVKDSVYNKVNEVSKEKNARLFAIDSSITMSIHEKSLKRQIFSIQTPYYSFRNIQTSLIGDYQVINSATVLLIIDVLRHKEINIKDSSIYRGFEKVVWPGRMEVVTRGNRIYILDGAHNVDGMTNFMESISNQTKLPPICIVGFNKDKDYPLLLDLMMKSKVFKKIIFTPICSPRTLLPEDLYEHYKENIAIKNSLKEAHEEALNDGKEGNIICCIGSLYLVGEMKDYLDREGSG